MPGAGAAAFQTTNKIFVPPLSVLVWRFSIRMPLQGDTTHVRGRGAGFSAQERGFYFPAASCHWPRSPDKWIEASFSIFDAPKKEVFKEATE
jgi:hypothetical protein